MNKAWTKSIKDGLRNQNILDLHDYYDFNRNKAQKIDVIVKQITDGTYRPKPPVIVRLEKKYGIARHLPIPTPEDALVLQTLADYLAPHIHNAQPSERAFFSRSHGFVGEDSIDESFSYPWWKLWPEFQKRIYGFTNKFDFVVVTDVSNYYDNIEFSKLRNGLSSTGHIDEALLDLLFYLLESFLWRPDYLPLNGVGLPQLNFDAPRILAHSFLFDIDKFLDKKTAGNFVRWMDDIDFGVNSVQEGKMILKELDEMLLVKGLRLNMGKTKILSSNDAKKYFLPDENRWLTIMTKRINALKYWKKSNKTEVADVKRRFKKFLKRQPVGRWTRLYARYFTIFQAIGSSHLVKFVPLLLENNPDIRESIFRYYISLGYNKERYNQLIDFYESEHCSDECTAFSVMYVLVSWQIKAGAIARKAIVDVANRTLSKSKVYFVSALWLLAKYGIPTDLSSAIDNNVEKWKYSSFVSRQVAAVLPRVRQSEKEYLLIRNAVLESGQLDALNVAVHHDILRLAIPKSKASLGYFLHGSKPNPLFPLQKIIIIEGILTNTLNPLKEREDFRDKVLARITDPIYREIINSSV